MSGIERAEAENKIGTGIGVDDDDRRTMLFEIRWHVQVLGDQIQYLVKQMTQP